MAGLFVCHEHSDGVALGVSETHASQNINNIKHNMRLWGSFLLHHIGCAAWMDTRPQGELMENPWATYLSDGCGS